MQKQLLAGKGMKQGQMRPLALLAAIAGNLMEWYDFGLYGVLAATLGRLFFPEADGFIGLLSVYGVFAAGYVARIAGGTLFGHIGDRFGRRRALLLSALVMALATFLVGCLPTYATFGVLAPVLFTILRLLQGLSVGGEFTTSLSYMIEHAPEGRRAFQGSFASMSATSGILLGSATGNLIFSLFTTEQILEWAWRIPFLLSLPMGIVILILRRVLPADMPNEEEHHTSSPFVRVVREHPALIVRGILLGWGPTVTFYLMAVFLSSFLATGHYLNQKTALLAQTLAIAVIITFTPVAGFLADFLGRKKSVLISSLACLALAYPLFIIIERGNLTLDFIAIGAFAILLAIGFSPYQVWLAEQFPSSLRTSGLGISYNGAVGVFGGTTPLLATALVQISGNPIAPAALIVLSSLATIGAALLMKETAREPLA
jgi:MHS family proline/betaine transporter-like MFS transporter